LLEHGVPLKANAYLLECTNQKCVLLLLCLVLPLFCRETYDNIAWHGGVTGHHSSYLAESLLATASCLEDGGCSPVPAHHKPTSNALKQETFPDHAPSITSETRQVKIESSCGTTVSQHVYGCFVLLSSFPTHDRRFAASVVFNIP